MRDWEVREPDSLRDEELQPWKVGSLWLHPITVSPHPSQSIQILISCEAETWTKLSVQLTFYNVLLDKVFWFHPTLLYWQVVLDVVRKSLHWELWLKVDKSIWCSVDKLVTTWNRNRPEFYQVHPTSVVADWTGVTRPDHTDPLCFSS